MGSSIGPVKNKLNWWIYICYKLMWNVMCIDVLINVYVAATTESSSDGGGNVLWQQACRHQTLCWKHTNKNSQ